jgi:hypothetical protein
MMLGDRGILDGLTDKGGVGLDKDNDYFETEDDRDQVRPNRGKEDRDDDDDEEDRNGDKVDYPALNFDY